MDLHKARAFLGVDAGSSLKQIRKAYRKKARDLHPDMSGSRDDDEMSELNQAYKELTQHEESQTQNAVISGGALGELPVGGQAHQTSMFGSASTAHLPVKLSTATPAPARDQTILTFRSGHGSEVRQKLWVHQDPKSGTQQLMSLGIPAPDQTEQTKLRSKPQEQHHLPPLHHPPRQLQPSRHRHPSSMQQQLQHPPPPPRSTSMPLSQFSAGTSIRERGFPDQLGSSAHRVPF